VYGQPGIQPHGRAASASASHRSFGGAAPFRYLIAWAAPLGVLVIPALLGGSLMSAGCGPGRTPYPQAFQSDRPQERAAAAKWAAELGDREAIGPLVDRLEDPDEAVRFYAILALEKLTGTRRGYDYRAAERDRWRAVQEWRRHLATESTGGAASVGGSDR